MRFRLRRDILRSWLLCDSGKEAVVEESSIENLYKELFRELDSKISGTIANKIAGGNAINDLKTTLDSQDSNFDKVDDQLELSTILGQIEDVKKNISPGRI